MIAGLINGLGPEGRAAGQKHCLCIWNQSRPNTREAFPREWPPRATLRSRFCTILYRPRDQIPGWNCTADGTPVSTAATSAVPLLSENGGY
jgi:hypothetical protein